MERGTMAKKMSNLEWSTMLFAHPWNGRTVEYQWANDWFNGETHSDTASDLHPSILKKVIFNGP